MDLDVSRETKERLEIFASLVEKWNPSINLVSKNSLSDLRKRHIADSVQVFRAVESHFEHWADIGSGGGFPGLVVAILSAEDGNRKKVTLVESDQRKAVFLRTVLRETAVSADVRAERVENTDLLAADVLSARALSDLPRLLKFAVTHLHQNGVAVFPKGLTWQRELAAAREAWNFDHEVIKSKTDPSGVLLKIRNIRSV
jgi:16S rRNA (guanine527-N7)-methyltransferase